MHNADIAARCDKVIRMLEEECQELQRGLRGDIMEQYEMLIRAETEKMKKIKKDIIHAMEYEQASL